MTSITKLTMKMWLVFLLMMIFAASAFAQNKDIILRVEPGKENCARPKIQIELPVGVMSDQKVKFKITYKSGGNQSTDTGEGNLEKDKRKYSLLIGRRGYFNGSIIVELTFADNSVAISNEMQITQNAGDKRCTDLMTGNQMAADPEPPPPVIKGRIVTSMKAEYLLANGQTGRACPANAAVSGTIAMNENGKETIYYTLVRWNAKSLNPLQPYYRVDLEKSAVSNGGGGTSTARAGGPVNVLPSSVNIVPSTWVIGEKGGLLSEGVVQLWSVIPGPNGTFKYGGFMASVNLSCGSSRGGSKDEPSKGGDSVIKPNRKPR